MLVIQRTEWTVLSMAWHCPFCLPTNWAHCYAQERKWFLMDQLTGEALTTCQSGLCEPCSMIYIVVYQLLHLPCPPRLSPPPGEAADGCCQKYSGWICTSRLTSSWALLCSAMLCSERAERHKKNLRSQSVTLILRNSHLPLEY